MRRIILTESQREKRNRFPEEISYEDLVKYFTLSPEDKAIIPVKSSSYNKLGFALGLCALRYLGFIPLDLTTAPINGVIFLSKQIETEADDIFLYGKRSQTKSKHTDKAIKHCKFKKPTVKDLNLLSDWLLDRAMEHTKPSYLIQITCEKLLEDKIVRPGITQIEKMVSTARNNAHKETYNRLSHIITKQNMGFIHPLLEENRQLGKSRLSWLRERPLTNSPPSILSLIFKLNWLLERGVFDWDLTLINPNRLRYLSSLGGKTSLQVLKRYSGSRRYPILIAYLYQSLIDLTDEIIEMYDRILSDTNNRAEHDLERYLLSIAKSASEKVIVLKDIGNTILNKEIADDKLRTTIYNHISEKELKNIIEECERMVYPGSDDHFNYIVNRYNYIRQFATSFLEILTFKSNQSETPLLEALELIKRLNRENKRKIPENTSLAFVPYKWKPYVKAKDGTIDRHYFELCALYELRNTLRSGDVWVEHSRKYATLDSYLISNKEWKDRYEYLYTDLKMPLDGNLKIEEKNNILIREATNFSQTIKKNPKVRIEKGNLIVSPLEAEEKPQSAIELENIVGKYLPQVDLCDLLIEVDSWTNFSQFFSHAGGYEPKGKDILKNIYACILSQGINMELTRMAQITDLSYDRLSWYNGWYIREDTLSPAVTNIVNHQYHQPLSKYWGDGTLSSSDGKRYPVSGKVKNAVYLPKYYGPYRGLTFYTWTADMFAQYGTKVVSSTIRDATYVLDDILDNETELKIMEHTTDTAGYTELIFALFDLLGLYFSPRLKDISDQRLFKIDKEVRFKNIDSLFKGKINKKIILNHWDEMIRVISSFKLGYVTASLFISKLQAFPRQNKLTQALQEYGRIVKTIFILKYLQDEDFRRKINKQLNKGEALHALRGFLFFANEGFIKYKYLGEQTNQALCLNLLTNAVITWNTVYMQAVIEKLKQEGYPVKEEDIVYLSPARYEHINPYGKYIIDVESNFKRMHLRPLRQPKKKY